MAVSPETATHPGLLRPVLREGRLRCPRCDARLALDRDHYACIACGYEYPLSEREVEIARAARASGFRGAAGVAAGFLGGVAVSGPARLLAILLAGGLLGMASQRLFSARGEVTRRRARHR